VLQMHYTRLHAKFRRYIRRAVSELSRKDAKATFKCCTDTGRWFRVRMKKTDTEGWHMKTNYTVNEKAVISH